jgi:hypothetical protein
MEFMKLKVKGRKAMIKPILKLNVKTMGLEVIQVQNLELKTIYDNLKVDENDDDVTFETITINKFFQKNRVIGLIDKSGKIKELDISAILVNGNGDILDTIAGNILFVGLEGEDIVGLTPEQMMVTKAYLAPKAKLENRTIKVLLSIW